MDDFKLFYIDASGDPGMYNGRNSSHYLIAGCGISFRRYDILSRGMSYVLNELRRISGHPIEELKTGDLIRRRKHYAKLSDSDVEMIVEKVINVIELTEPVIIAVAFDKQKYSQKYEFTNAVDIKLRALNYLVDRIDRFLSRNDMLGMLIYDYEGKDDKHYRALIRELKTKGSYSKTMGIYRSVRNIVDTITFVPSETAYGIQLADFVSYITYGYIVGREPSATIFNRIRPYFDKDQRGRIENWGLKMIP